MQRGAGRTHNILNSIETMKIQLKESHVAVLKEESGEVVAVFNSSNYANDSMMTAVAEHFDVAMVGLNTDRDFVQPFDYEQPYDFVLYKDTGEDECITLTMTFTPIY